MGSELTLPDFDGSAPDATWRGRQYLREVEPLLKQLGRGVGDGVEDWQLAYVGYSPASDTFVLAFDLWLEDEVDAEGEPGMACSVVTCRLESRHGKWTAVPGPHERREPEFFGEPYQQLQGRFPDLIDLRLS